MKKRNFLYIGITLPFVIGLIILVLLYVNILSQHQFIVLWKYVHTLLIISFVLNILLFLYQTRLTSFQLRKTGWILFILFAYPVTFLVSEMFKQNCLGIQETIDNIAIWITPLYLLLLFIAFLYLIIQLLKKKQVTSKLFTIIFIILFLSLFTYHRLRTFGYSEKPICGMDNIPVQIEF